jgi:hypothetical protein
MLLHVFQNLKIEYLLREDIHNGNSCDVKQKEENFSVGGTVNFP